MAERFQILNCIGRGNFGDVYKAQDTWSNSVVAVKVVNLENSEEDVDLLAQEIFFLAELRSPHITTYITTVIEDVSMWIAMEYCGGGSVSDLLRLHYTDGLPEPKTRYVVREILCGLIYLHSQRKIHRDIKAANVLLTDEGKVKLSDFGVSGRLLSSFRRGTFVGTPYWMAPEVVSNELSGYDEKADIWSLGITVVELLKGSPPLSKYDPMKVIANIPKRKAPRLHGEFSEDAKKFVSLCLIKDATIRPAAKDLLTSRFVMNIRIDNLQDDVQLLKEIKIKLKKTEKVPKFPLQNKIYKENSPESVQLWDFTTSRKDSKICPKYDVQEHPSMETCNTGVPDYTGLLSNLDGTESAFESPISNDMISPYVNSAQDTVTPITPMIGEKSYKKYTTNIKPNYQYELGSGMEIDAQTPNIESEHNNQTEVPKNKLQNKIVNQVSKHKYTTISIEGFDYHKNIIVHSFKRMKERAHDKATKQHVENILAQFNTVEALIPGFSEVFIEEVSLRLDALRSYCAKQDMNSQKI
ncbi:Sporulation-specific protein 1 [Nakaseomyces bracarensis]|uniref:non-specific serine/threonine protein kinase n=1 Tax=Nakaseomyces bracarensis TaxID=273131 RepID=A0ABR4NTQ4_9SACH